MKRACIQIVNPETGETFAELQHKTGESWELLLKSSDGTFSRFDMLSVYRIQDALRLSHNVDGLKFVRTLREE